MNLIGQLRPLFPGLCRSVLLSYLKPPRNAARDDPLTGHSNQWQSREIARLIEKMGMAVDVIDWDDGQFQPRKKYWAMIDIHQNLQRVAPCLPKNARLLLHVTGSYQPFQNQAERTRVLEFERRTGFRYRTKRDQDASTIERSLEIAHSCSLIGNEQTLSTFPEKYRKKITPVPVSGSVLARHRDRHEIAASSREFLWFFGLGAVHKGLDLVLDVFARRQDLVLHVAGPVDQEADFMAAYGAKMSAPNIRVHGWIDPASKKFVELLKDVFCFIAPSCSEGTSPAVITCMQFGLLPIVSRACGVTLPPNAGIYLESLCEAEIERCVHQALSLSVEAVTRQTLACQSWALRSHSREAFSRAMGHYLKLALG